MSLEDLAKKAEEGFEKVVDAAKEKAEEAKEKLAELAGDAKDKAEDAKDKAEEIAEDATPTAEYLAAAATATAVDVTDELEKCATRGGRTNRPAPFSIPSSNPAGVLFPDNLTPASAMRTKPGQRRA